MNTYTIGQLASMANVTVRTLHHYDQIGLLSPMARSDAGYRLYGEVELLRLQQILFYKELDMPLDQVREILNDPQFDTVAALVRHRELLQGRMAQLVRLLRTVDGTIARLTEDDMTLTDKELYEGFTSEQAARYRREARELYGSDTIERTEQRIKGWSPGKWQAIKDEGQAITVGIAKLIDREPHDPEAQAFVARHHAWIENFFSCTADTYRGLAQGYVDHPEFRPFYEKYRPGLAEFLSAAMRHYADEVLDGQDE